MIKPGTIVDGKVKTGDGWLEITMVQPEGSKPMHFKDWLRGLRLKDGEVLGG